MLHVETYAATPIPPLTPVDGWKERAINECGEPLVALSTFQHARLLFQPEYFRLGLPGALPEIYMRESVALKLVEVASSLPAGMSLLVWDAWRPLTVQQALFSAHYQRIQAQSPALAEDELTRLTEVYVGFPSGHPLRPSPHYTGGSVDLTLVDAHGKPLDMGTEFDAFYAAARTRCFEQRLEQGEHLSEAEQLALRHRRILYHAMLALGFTNYLEEWWHFDYGNQFWSAITANSALYGPIEP